jgi:hypothetical protein
MHDSVFRSRTANREIGATSCAQPLTIDADSFESVFPVGEQPFSI